MGDFSAEKQFVLRLAAAVCVHIAVALKLVAGQTWAALQPDQDCGTHCPGGTAHVIRVRGTASAASRLSLHACPGFGPGSRAASAQADSDTRRKIRNMPSPTERKARGLD